MMNRINQLLVLSICGLVSTAWAGAFDGFYGTLGAGVSANNMKISENLSETGVGSLSENNYFGHTGVLGQVAVGYSFSLPAKFNLALEVFSNFNSSFNNSAVAGTDSVINAKYVSDYTLKNMFGASFKPGYYISDDTLFYGVISYANARYDANEKLTNMSGSTVYENVSTHSTLNGIGYGAGIAHVFSNHVLLSAELEQFLFQEKKYTITAEPGLTGQSQIKPSAVFGLVKLGYIF